MFEIQFQPNAFSRFLKLPMTELINKRIDAEAILNPDIHQVYEQMVNVHSYEEIIKIAETYLWSRIQRLKDDFHPIDKVIGLISKNTACFNIEKMASLACLSVSQFERRFVQQMGIMPKLFTRINRFYTAYEMKDKNPEVDWMSIALETGYYDYQHLVKDFKQFAGTTPYSLLKAQANAPERILRIG